MSYGYCDICGDRAYTTFECPACGQLVEACENDRDAISVDVETFCPSCGDEPQEPDCEHDWVESELEGCYCRFCGVAC